ncbi:MAG TPA: cytochrome c oxidase assembly protein [Puia sp.]|nr:cytochrome c oxidase assembly protein [Puia sp.]
MRALSFFIAIVLLASCVAVPLPAMDANAPFSSHMVRHTSLLLLVAPLLILSIPMNRLSARPLIALSRITARLPFAAWITGVAVMWIWHVPGWYNATAGNGLDIVGCAPLGPALSTHLAAAVATSHRWLIADRIIPLLHDASLLAAGVLFWWPVINPCRSFRLPPLRAVVYLASACICCSLLGLLITFARPGVYRGIGLTDQQTGGMIMWVPCCIVYLTASMGLLIGWLSKKETDMPITV